MRLVSIQLPCAKAPSLFPFPRVHVRPLAFVLPCTGTMHTQFNLAPLLDALYHANELGMNKKSKGLKGHNKKRERKSIAEQEKASNSVHEDF